MEQSPSWEVNRFAASQEIPRILRKPKVHYCIQKCLPPVRILSQLNPVHTPHHTSWRSVLILSSLLCLGLPSGLFPSGFPAKIPYTPLSSPICATCPAHLILLDFITRTILGEKCRSLNKISHWKVTFMVKGQTRSAVCKVGRLRLKYDGIRAETTFRLSAKQTSPFKSAGGISSVDYLQPTCAHQR